MTRYIRYILPNKKRFSIDRVINTDIRTLTSEPPPIRFRIALLISFHMHLGVIALCVPRIYILIKTFIEGSVLNGLNPKHFKAIFDNWMEECPCCSVFLNVVTLSCFVVTLWAIGDDTERNGLSPRDIAALPAVIFLLLYAFYLIECYRAATRRYLSIVKQVSAMAYIEAVRLQSPVILIKATGWHYEQKQRMIPYRDARGKLRERIESHQERVVTFDESEKFSFTRWTDITELPEGLENSSLTRMEIKKEFHFADEPTKNLFTNLSHAFQARNRHRDRYMDYEEELVIDGFEDHVVAYIDPLKREWWIVSTWYWIFSALMISWIYRWMIVRRTRQLSVTILKQVEVCF